MEIRRIRDGEGDAVARLWDRMCRELADGGPLTEQGRRSLARMLAMSAWHRDAFCLVAEHQQGIAGFVNGRTNCEHGLLPGMYGEIDSLYVLPEERHQGVSRALARAAVSWLRDRGAHTIRYLSCADAGADHQFWQELGFTADMVCLSLYRED